ncbi:hypothetical protein AB1Y20_002197 [Prymnesium parvum]|uniref:Heterokaryon incompatibility domain-containing protein n=1 Tax=Prymnesium parvum TaxID=97485 RepID=A0AB34J8F9_PRYPA
MHVLECPHELSPPLLPPLLSSRRSSTANAFPPRRAAPPAYSCALARVGMTDERVTDAFAQLTLVECRFPCYLVAIDTILGMQTFLPLQQLQLEGKVLKWAPGMKYIFVSHQWLSSLASDETIHAHPDPHGQQLRLLQSVLRKMRRGVDIHPRFDAKFTGLPFKSLLKAHTRALCAGGLFVWIDFCSTPQQCGVEGELVSSKRRMADAIRSIPSYIEKCEIFLALVPEIDTFGLNSWQRRGWCRMEMLARLLAAESGVVIVAESSRRDAPLATSPGGVAAGGGGGAEGARAVHGGVWGQRVPQSRLAVYAAVRSACARSARLVRLRSSLYLLPAFLITSLTGLEVGKADFTCCQRSHTFSDGAGGTFCVPCDKERVAAVTSDLLSLYSPSPASISAAEARALTDREIRRSGRMSLRLADGLLFVQPHLESAAQRFRRRYLFSQRFKILSGLPPAADADEGGRVAPLAEDIATFASQYGFSEAELRPSRAAQRGWSPLRWAVLEANLPVVRALLRSTHADADAPLRSTSPHALALGGYYRGLTLLHCAVWSGAPPELLDVLLAARADPHARDGKGLDALFLACFSGRRELAARLLDACPTWPLDRPWLNGNTALTFAACHGHTECVAELLRRRANPFPVHWDGSSTLHGPAIFGHAAMLQLLLAQPGAQIDRRAWPTTPLFRVVMLVCRLGARLSRDGSAPGPMGVMAEMHGSTPLGQAASANRIGAVRILLDAAADPSIPNRQGCTPLQRAEQGGHTAVAELLSSLRAKKEEHAVEVLQATGV